MSGGKVERTIATMGAAVGRQFRLMTPTDRGGVEARVVPRTLPLRKTKKT